MSPSSWRNGNGETSFEVLWEDSERILRRSWHNRADGAQYTVLEVVPVAEHAARGTLDRLTHEYELKDALSEAWAAQPLGLVRERGQIKIMLVLKDPGGEPLDRLAGKPLGFETFMRLGVGIASALARLHECSLIHKDIKPANILADCVTGRAWLTGFGIASRRTREQQSPEPPESIAGTLAYMAPEQTGRMNRSIDSRSDLYSLGVTLYQLLTGSLPFSAASPMEWVHCHIARKPVPPCERSGNVPTSVSAIVMKLLAKTAEDRYQTAAGVESDLRRCLTEWEKRHRFNEFLLGKCDMPDRLLIPEKLYGRTSETETLLASFNRVVENGTPELVLVSGYSGVGKSSVVNELHKALVPLNGLFASGKFDQYKRNIPYTTLAQAFQSLVHPLLSKGEGEFRDWRNAIQEALGPNARLIFDLVPELKLIVGEQPPVPVLPLRDSQRRFQLVFRQFISVFARPEHPLALFLDDLQWLDAATLDLLENLLTQPDVRHLLLIGAYRDNEVDFTHPLMRKLEAIRRAGAQVQEIVLTPLARQDLEQMTGDSLRCEPQRAASLAQLLHEKTEGNPFFVIQFLSSLADEALVDFDHRKARWTWDLKRIHAKGYTDNVVDLMVAKLSRLPLKSQAVLQQLACLGDSASVAVLSMVCEESEDETRDNLQEAVKSGLVLQSESAYRFLHDRVREGAYSFIPESLRAATHLRTGRLLAAHTPLEDREEAIFEIVNQLNRGAALVTSTEERKQIAELNLIAGQRAKDSTAYDSALTYLIAGRAILPEDCWERYPTLTFALDFHRSECEFLTGALAEADERLSVLSAHATRLVDVAAVTQLREELFTTIGRSDRAIEVCLDYLRHIGVHWSAHPTTEEIRQEFEQLWRQIADRAIQDLIDLPVMTDPERSATMDVLTAVVSPALFTNANLLCLVVCRMANLSLEYGNCDGSCFAYAWLGMILGSYFSDYQTAFRFGKLGLDLVEQRGLRRFEARVYLIVGHRVMPWTQPIHAGRPLVLRAFDAANKLGDLTFAAYSRDNLITNLIACGDPLADVQREAEAGLEFARRACFGLLIDRITAQIRLIKTLRGLTPDFASFNDSEFDESRFERHLESDPHLAMAGCWYWIRKLQARFFAGEYESALAAAAYGEHLLWTAPSFFEVAEYHLYAALTRAAMIDSASTAERTQHLEALTAHHRQLREWSDACPENFANRTALVAAEIARLEHREFAAAQLYEQAICSARANGFVHNEALANEIAARFYAAHGFEKIARIYLQDAHHGYLRWGADAKVRQLESRHPGLAITDARGGSRAPPSPDQPIDVAAVVRASQTLSGEMLLPRLIEQLMTIALQNAGAERGLLILIWDGEPRIEAEAATGQGKIEVAARHAAITPSDLPQSVLHYAIRTQERVLLDDASADHVYSRDEYVRQRRSKSILCLPIVKQRKLVGALYLENNLTPFVFTTDRVAVLQLLASQAAISLESAHLYSDLQLQAGLLQRLPVSAWTLDPDGTPDFVNQVWLDYSGQTLDFVRSHPEAWMTAVHPDDREAATTAFWDGVRSGQGFAVETRSLSAQDGSYRWHLQQAVVLRDAEGKVLKFIGTTTDIDEQKRAEDALRQAQADLERINRATTMGELAASLAHEINQPITAVIAHASGCRRWLDRDKPGLDEALAAVTNIVRDGQRAAQIIARIRTQFEKGALNQEVVGVSEIVRETVGLLRGEAARYDISVRTELAAGLPQIVGDRVQLQQVAMNLIVNSIEAMKDVDGIREMVIRSRRAENGQILVSVSDTGMGVPPQLAEQIFDPFFTTKSHGTGMGLRISRSIVESHGGRLWVTGAPGRGAVFQFTLPVAVADRN
ncbi:PAS domain S-box-containing protein [Burkholderia sp. YR290]|nr:PAS domain S-box-containing protein [Burkholderia sp. YR290]